MPTQKTLVAAWGAVMRLVVGCVVLAFCGASLPVLSQAAVTHYELNIPREPLDQALKEFARQTGLQVARFSDVTRGVGTQGPVVGTFTSDQALQSLLSGSGLTYRVLNSRTIAIVRQQDMSPAATEPSSSGQQGSNRASKDSNNEDEQKAAGSFWDRFRLAQVAPGSAAISTPVGPNDQPSTRQPAQLEEVVVTAQKRAELLQDVPMSITALSGEELERSESFRLEDYVGKIPGVVLLGVGIGDQVIIRGVTSGSIPTNSAVATYIDETPYTTEGPFANALMGGPNLDPFDMQRIEVLKGPQGTLYGANALAGIVKYVTNAPDPSQFSATAESGVSSVHNGGTGFDVHGALNLPLTSDAALRIVGYDNYYPGFIDDPSRGLKDTNGSRYEGGRASLLYAPTSDLSVRVTAVYQDRKWNDYDDIDVDPHTLAPLYGGLTQEKLINNQGSATTELYNATIDWTLDFAKLLSTTTYYSFHPAATYEYPTLNAVVGSILGPQYAGAGVTYNVPVNAWTQEVRLSSPDTGKLQWLAGVYFTDESSHDVNNLYVIDVATKTILFNYPQPIDRFDFRAHYREYAGFADLDYYFLPTVDLSAGARYSTNWQSLQENNFGLFVGPQPVLINNDSSQDVVTYSANLRWKVTPKTMAYVRVASGFAPGGPNDVFTGSSFPTSYKSSTTTNYEIGVKSNLTEQVAIELSAFQIKWHDIQLEAVAPNGLSGYINGGAARNDGVEWNFTYVPLRGLSLNLNGSYMDAYLTEPTPTSVNGRVGDRLPYVPLWEASAGGRYEHPVFGHTGFFGVDWRFSGERNGDFLSGSPRIQVPSFNLVDLRTGVENKRWSLALYVKNVGNKIAIASVTPETLGGSSGPLDAHIYTPRTFGATLTVRF